MQSKEFSTGRTSSSDTQLAVSESSQTTSSTHVSSAAANANAISEAAGLALNYPQGHVSVNERVPNQRFSRFVDERVREWIFDHEMANNNPEYEVAFYDEEALGEVSCLIVVQAGPQLWRSWETADTQKEALEMSLANLKVEDAEPVASPKESARGSALSRSTTH